MEVVVVVVGLVVVVSVAIRRVVGLLVMDLAAVVLSVVDAVVVVVVGASLVVKAVMNQSGYFVDAISGSLRIWSRCDYYFFLFNNITSNQQLSKSVICNVISGLDYKD